MVAAGWGSIIGISSVGTASTAAWGDRPNAPPQSTRHEPSRRTRTVKRAMRKSKRKITRAGAATKPAKMYRTSMRDVPQVAGLKGRGAWVDLQVHFRRDRAAAGADHVVGWTVLKPGACHERHRHHNCDEFFIVLKGHGHIYTDDGEAPSGEGDVVYSPRKCWH